MLSVEGKQTTATDDKAKQKDGKPSAKIRY